MDADAVVVGAGLAGLVATAELADAGRKVVLVERQPEQSFGGQAFSGRVAGRAAAAAG